MDTLGGERDWFGVSGGGIGGRLVREGEDLSGRRAE